MTGRDDGYRSGMTDDRERPTMNHPLHGPKRTAVKPALIVLGIFAIGIAVMVLIGYLRYNT